jgi:hypothetical protein
MARPRPSRCQVRTSSARRTSSSAHGSHRATIWLCCALRRRRSQQMAQWRAASRSGVWPTGVACARARPSRSCARG